MSTTMDYSETEVTKWPPLENWPKTSVFPDKQFNDQHLLEFKLVISECLLRLFDDATVEGEFDSSEYPTRIASGDFQSSICNGSTSSHLSA